MQRNTGYFPTESLEPSGNRLFSRSALNEGDLFRGSLTLEAKAAGVFTIWVGESLLGRVAFSSRKKWEKRTLALSTQGTKAMYFHYFGKPGGALRGFSFERKGNA